jgi:hypothetical protein
MPVITRLSSTRGLPGRPCGRCGSIRAPASSENQNNRAIAIFLRGKLLTQEENASCGRWLYEFPSQ